jgi:hypothetical protein
LLRDAGLVDVAVVGHRTKHLMLDVDTLWRAGIGGMAVTASAITTQDVTTQARVREAIARRAEAYKSPRGLEIPIAFFIGSGQKV